jgi:hypothetical protein
MKTTIYILLLLALTSCGAIKRGMQNNYVLYYKTKAFFVVEEINEHKLKLINAQGTQYFIYNDFGNKYCPGDTIKVHGNYELLGELKLYKNEKRN